MHTEIVRWLHNGIQHNKEKIAPAATWVNITIHGIPYLEQPKPDTK